MNDPDKINIVLVGFFVLYFIWISFKPSYFEKEAKRVKAKNQALQLYVKTGRKSKAFYSADRSAIASAERARVRLLNEQRREIENYNIEFKAVQQCPKCKEFDVHWLRTREDGKINGRVCKHCGYGWHTVG